MHPGQGHSSIHQCCTQVLYCGINPTFAINILDFECWWLKFSQFRICSCISARSDSCHDILSVKLLNEHLFDENRILLPLGHICIEHLLHINNGSSFKHSILLPCWNRKRRSAHFLLCIFGDRMDLDGSSLLLWYIDDWWYYQSSLRILNIG